MVFDICSEDFNQTTLHEVSLQEKMNVKFE